MKNNPCSRVCPIELLGREERAICDEEARGEISGKTILVTGGGGSIGSEICRQISRFSPERIVIFDIYENTAYELLCELQDTFGKGSTAFDVEIGSIRDSSRVKDVFDTYVPHWVFHAAAHKHVPLMEKNPREAILNNVFGTLEVMNNALEHSSERFVFISTDKAVNPTSVMGATKRMGEMLVQSFTKRDKTIFSAVRFGNVLGSHGSVLPLFERQVAAGGPLKVTHRDIVRYFMSIPEAARLVIGSTMLAEGGEIFVLDMGEPVRIYDMAERFIELCGLNPHEDIEIEIMGLRPGEKLYEELFMDEEDVLPTSEPGIMITRPAEVSVSHIERSLELLRAAANAGDKDEAIAALSKAIPTYAPKRQ